MSKAAQKQEKIEDKALEWWGLLYGDEPTDRIKRKFVDWLAVSGEHRDAFARLQMTMHTLGQSDRIEEWLAEVEPTTSEGRGGRLAKVLLQRWRPFMAVAAAIMAIALSVTLLYSPAPSVPDRYTTGIAETRAIELTDGTRIILGAASTVDVRYSKQQREVDLIRGSAFFDVAHDKDRPLLVDASQTEIRVLGTRFAVRYGPQDVTVSLSEGRISVGKDVSDTPGTHEGLTTIEAGTRVTTALTGDILSEETVDLETDLAWVNGYFSYNGTPLLDVVADLNRYRARKVRIVSPDIETLQITATVRLEQIEQFIDSLPAIYPVSVTDKGGETLIHAHTD